ncbi:MAG: hypothetical protein K8R77_02190 [Anaerolineaceae bacterium]|nr:hypothetical protein [Anaerolineaceae bacterium]
MKKPRQSSRLGNNADVIILAVLLLTLFASLYWNIGWLESAVGVLLAFIIPGWLFVRLLFGERPFELEVEVLLILFISVFLISLEVLLLIYFNIAISKELFQLMAAITDCLLLLILKIKNRRSLQSTTVPRRINWPSLLAAVLVPLVLFAFGLWHIHETRESFTELYVASDGVSADEPLNLIVESHEEHIQFFTLVCQAQEGERLILGNFELSPGQQQRITIAYSYNMQPDVKLKIALDQHKGAAGYRWIEIPGDACDQLQVEFE